ncbi:MAG: hypothetical protein AB1Z65_03425, partial [Candidatus Sulfomarinibacteraceae bacterium]
LGVGTDETTATLLASNTGGEPLFITVMGVTSPYRIVDVVDLPVEIPPGSAQVIEIGLLDGASGTQYGDLTIHSNDPAVPMAKVPLRAHATDAPPVLASFPAAASGPGLGDTRWSSRAYLFNPTDETLYTDLVFRTGDERAPDHPDAGYEIPPRSQRVISDLVSATGAEGSGGVNLRTSDGGLVAVSRTFASGAGGTYGQFIGGWSHDRALSGEKRYVLAGLAGNGGFHTNVGVLNLGDNDLAVDVTLFSSEGERLGTRRINAVPGGFKQVVSLIDKLTDRVIRGGYATLSAEDPDADYLAYASIVDDASHDPTLVLPSDMSPAVAALDLAIPAVASLPGSGGTTWRSQLDVVNTSESQRSVTIEYNRQNGSSVASMPMTLEPGQSLHFDDVVGGLFGEQGKGWLHVMANGSGVTATSRTYNDDPSGTYGQLIPATPLVDATGPSETVVLAGLRSDGGFRTNIGLTSTGLFPGTCRLDFFTNDGAEIGTTVAELPVRGFTQLERVLASDLAYTGEAWAEVACSDPSTFFVHASVVDGTTGDPTYIPGMVIDGAP